MQLIKSALISLSFAVLMFVAKPFIGFGAFKQLHQIKHISICVKAFSKRKQEYIEGSSLDIQTVLKKLRNPADSILLTFSALLSIVLPLLSGAENIANRILRELEFRLPPTQPYYLLNGNLLI
ncbi:MAG: hypothetical protein V4577_31845 [Bacteroidota bacterium]